MTPETKAAHAKEDREGKDGSEKDGKENKESKKYGGERTMSFATQSRSNALGHKLVAARLYSRHRAVARRMRSSVRTCKFNTERYLNTATYKLDDCTAIPGS